MSKVKVTPLDGDEKPETRIACDGCCGAFLADSLEKQTRHKTADGRRGHVCSYTCELAFENGMTAEVAAIGHPQYTEPEPLPTHLTDDDGEMLPLAEQEFHEFPVEHPGLGPGVPWPAGVPLPGEGGPEQ